MLLKNKRQGRLTRLLLEAHVDHLKALRRDGRLPFCGPFADNSSALLVLRAASESDARKVVESDPFVRDSYYREFECHEVLESGDENDWLMSDAQTVGNIQ